MAEVLPAAAPEPLVPVDLCMADPPQNPFDSPQEKGPWLYSGAPQPTPAYTPPTRPPDAPTPASPSAAPATPAAAKDAPSQPAAATPPAAAPLDNQKSKIKNQKSQDDASLASVIDTIEAIIIALILALTFRAFILEAFVIPTGSMAPTLLGAHFNVVCPKCGYAFTRDASLHYQLFMRDDDHGDIMPVGDRSELTSNTSIPCDGDDGAPLICPNCGYIIPYKTLPQYLKPSPSHPIIYDDKRRGQGVHKDVPFAWANNGDRILVLKYIYAMRDPQRFDVIVFKEPMAAQDNFIKRLIGLPGETVEIIDGDIYITPPGENTNDRTLRQIARKPLHVQNHLWQLVYDNDFYPTDEGPAAARAGTTGLPSRSTQAKTQGLNLPSYYDEWHNPWVGAGPAAAQWNQPGLAFATVGGPVVTYRGSTPGSLTFNQKHEDPYTYNVLGYNNDIQELYPPSSTLWPVGDLRLQATWTPTSATQDLAITIGQARNRFRVTWSHHDLQLFHYNPATAKYDPAPVQQETLSQQPVAGHPYNVAMNNVDRQIQFFIGGKLVLQHDTPWNAQQAFDEQQQIQTVIDTHGGTLLDILDPQVQIDVGGACTLGHLKVFRDLYYTQSERPTADRSPGAATTGHPLTLGPDEFFAMGDNSRKSHDGRSWQTVYPALDDLATRRGIVPRRYLLGKAIYVYWPAGFRFSDEIPYFPLVPNAGDMRFIR